MTRRAADLLVDCLAEQGVTRLFCVPGESYLSVLDSLYDRAEIDVVTCRHEGGAGFMALADGKITGQPGICFVSRGPGASNATIALHSAEQDAVPFVLFIGHVPRRELGRGAFQEVDYAKTFADIAKDVWTVHDPETLPEIVARAFVVASQPTPGPVVVVLPEDMLDQVAIAEPLRFSPPARLGSGGEQVDEILERLSAAERPLLIAGGELSGSDGRAALLAVAEAHDLPVASTFKREDIFPKRHRCYAGHLGFKIPAVQLARYMKADLILAVGTRLGEVPTQGYRFPLAPCPEQPLIHVHRDPAQLNRIFSTEFALTADPVDFLNAMAARARPNEVDRGDWAAELHAPIEAALEWRPGEVDELDLGPLVAKLAGQLPEDAVVITDAGNFSSWVHRHFPFSGRHLLIGAVGGAMGLAVPAAIAAALRLPSRQAVTFVGDGGFLMTGNELAVAVQRSLPIRIFVADNGSYGTIRMHQERDYPRRNFATDLHNPDFARLAEAFGALGLSISSVEQVDGVVEQALSHDGPVVVSLRTSVERITAFATLDKIRRQ
ncbi:thiamine pyrophosphate-dependent enzyme [Algihabitans albus]|uniref:thiamine pyrophosphate-dependent enzyme n=1 Tax=Algihabitans albus TaxID=2164067 RepID=UPI000E5D7B67|nr:thiamine pyrophosphate-dependent enzyme [Algihabitans albus]